MNATDYFRFLAALIFVLALIGILGWLLRRYASGAPPTRRGERGRKRLSIVEVRPIDPKRRLILVRRDDVEHLILTGPQADVVIERGIGAGTQAGNRNTDFEQMLAGADPATPDPHPDDRDGAENKNGNRDE